MDIQEKTEEEKIAPKPFSADAARREALASLGSRKSDDVVGTDLARILGSALDEVDRLTPIAAQVPALLAEIARLERKIADEREAHARIADFYGRPNVAQAIRARGAP